MKSIKLYQECLERRKIVFGENHPDNLGIIFNLGMNYTMIGKVHEAERLVQDCYDRSCVLLGRDHPDTLQFAEMLKSFHSIIYPIVI